MLVSSALSMWTRAALDLPAMSVTDLHMAMCSCKYPTAISPMSASSAVDESESLLEDDILSEAPAVAVFLDLYGGSPSVVVGSWIVIVLLGLDATISTASSIAPLRRDSKLAHRVGTSPPVKFHAPDASFFALASAVCHDDYPFGYKR